MRWISVVSLLALSAFTSCTCADEPGGGGDGTDTGTAAGDADPGGGPGRDGSLVIPDASAPPIPGARSLRIEPPSVTLTTDGTTPARQTFRVIAEQTGGGSMDVTTQVAFALTDPSLGRMEGADFVSALFGGRTTLVAVAGALSASASIEVRVQRSATLPVPGEPALPADPGAIFGRAPADPGRAPRVVYPNDGVLLPPNLGSVELHWRPGDDNQLFEISVTSPGFSLVLYTRCAELGDGCVARLRGDLWTLVASSHRGSREPARVKIRGTDDQGTGAGTSSEIAIFFSAIPVAGGLYYWTTSNGTGIMRVDFGALDRPPERFFPFRGGGCYGCHALARNGRKMSLSEDGQWQGQLTLLDVASRTISLTGNDDYREQFQSWDPTSTRFVGAWGDDDPPDTNLRIRNGTTGAIEERIPIGSEVTHPDWSPAGDRILFTLVTRHYTSQRPGRAGISYVEKSGAGWSAARELIAPADGLNRYYPAVSPDGQFFVYNESTCPRGEIYDGSCDGDADPSAKLHAMGINGGRAIALAKANAPGIEDNGETDLSSTFPKWAPFVDPRWSDRTGRVMWMTFSSRREYGLRSPNGSDQLLWMVAIDPDAVLAGQDGSYAAFALPFQDLETSNHIAQWAAQIVPSTPSDDGGIPSGATDGGAGWEGGIDPGNGGDGGRSDGATDPGGSCLGLGDVCDPANNRCCSGATCAMNGPNLYLCRPEL